MNELFINFYEHDIVVQQYLTWFTDDDDVFIENTVKPMKI